MSFLNPFFLIGLAALAIPLIIHLINLRKPERLPFSTLAFFEELQKSTIKRIKIKQYLLLLLRIAAIVFLALALARPFLPPATSGSGGSDQPRVVALLIDNSPSMGQIDEQGPYLDQALQVARDIVNRAPGHDRFLVETTNGESLEPTLVNASEAGRIIDKIENQNKGNFIASRLQQLHNQAQDAPFQRGVVYLITDGQKTQLQPLEDVESLNDSDSPKIISVQTVLVGTKPQKNVAITSIDLKSKMISKGNPVSIQAEVRNYSDEPVANQFISMEVGGRVTGQYEVNLDANASQKFMFELVPNKTGDVTGRFVLEGDDITFDNQRYFVVNVPASRSALLVSDAGQQNSDFASYLKPTLEAAEETNAQVKFDEVYTNQLSQKNWQTYDVLIFDGLKTIPEYLFTDLQRYVQNGKGILFLPSEQGDVNNYNKFFKLVNAGKFEDIRGDYASFKPVARVEHIVEGHPILDEMFDKKKDESIKLDMPELFFYYVYNDADRKGSFDILKSTIGDPLLVEQQFGDGKILISALGADPGWSNFPVNPLFAPIYYRSVLYAASTEKGGLADENLGNTFQWTGALPEQSIDLIKDSLRVKPNVEVVNKGYKITYAGKEWNPGWVKIKSGETQKTVAVNQNIMESDFSTLQNSELKEFLNKHLSANTVINAGAKDRDELNDELDTAGFGKEIWNWFVWIALILLITETFISKWYKAESIA